MNDITIFLQLKQCFVNVMRYCTSQFVFQALSESQDHTQRIFQHRFILKIFQLNVSHFHIILV